MQNANRDRSVRLDVGVRLADSRPSWFADEIAIDFPSLPALIDRMRAAFLASEDREGGAVRRDTWHASSG